MIAIGLRLLSAFLLLTAATAVSAQLPGLPRLPALPQLPSNISSSAPPQGAVAGRSNVASVVTDRFCDTVFEPTGPLTMASILAVDLASNAISQVSLDLSKLNLQRVQPNEAELRKKFKSLSRTSTWLPIEIEEIVGQSMTEKVPLLTNSDVTTGRRAADYARVTGIFDRLVAALPADQPYRFRLRFSPDTSENLVTIPGGTVVVNTGVVQKDSDLIAALLAHEIAHVTKRHYTRQIQGYIADTVTVSEVVQVVGTVGVSKERIGAWFGGVKYLDQLFTKFYADQELEADSCIPRFVKAAGYSEEKASNAFMSWVMASAAAASPEAGQGKEAKQDRAPFEMRHPPSEDRVTALTSSRQHWSARDPKVASASSGPLQAKGANSLTPQQEDATQRNAAKDSNALSEAFSSVTRAVRRMSEPGQQPTQPGTDNAPTSGN